MLDGSDVSGKAFVQTWKGDTLLSQASLMFIKVYVGHGGFYYVYHVGKTGKKATLTLSDGMSNSANACVLLGNSRVNFNGYH